jgi:hypothetical protein
MNTTELKRGHRNSVRMASVGQEYNGPSLDCMSRGTDLGELGTVFMPRFTPVRESWGVPAGLSYDHENTYRFASCVALGHLQTSQHGLGRGPQESELTLTHSHPPQTSRSYLFSAVTRELPIFHAGFRRSTDVNLID